VNFIYKKIIIVKLKYKKNPCTVHCCVLFIDKLNKINIMFNIKDLMKVSLLLAIGLVCLVQSIRVDVEVNLLFFII